MKYVLYYGFLAIPSVVAGIILPLAFIFGAIGIHQGDYLKGGALIAIMAIGNYMCIRAFGYRKTLGRKGRQPPGDPH